jgi:condensation domain-containing protein
MPSAAPAPPVEEGVRLLPTQEFLLRLHRRLPDPAVLNMAYVLNLAGPLSDAALATALAGVVDRHEPLRTACGLAGEGVRGRVLPPGSFRLDRADLSSLAPAEREEAIARHAAAEAATPFDLGRPPLLRARLLALGPGEHVLLLTFHHVVADGWSLEVCGRELSLLYAAACSGEPAGLKPLSRSLAEVALEQAEWEAGAAAEGERRWWRRRLAGLPGGLVPRLARPPGPAGTRLRRVVVLPAGPVERLLEAGRPRGATLFMAMAAVTAAVVARRGGDGEALLGTLIAGRHSAAATRLLGAHYDGALLRLRAADDDALSDVLAHAVEETVEVAARRLRFAAVARLLGEAAGVGGALVPAAMLVVDRYPLHRLALEEIRVTPRALPTALRNPGECEPLATVPAADLVFFVREGEGAPTLTLFWDPQRVDDAGGLIDSFLAALELFADDPETRVRDLPESPGPDAAPPRPAAGARLCLPLTGGLLVDALSPVPCPDGADRQEVPT